MIELSTRDGGRFEVRPMAAADGPAVRAFFASLSNRSTRLRFFSPKVTDAVLDRLATVDPDELVLLAVDPSDRSLAAVARATRRPDDPTVADVAVTVADGHQGQGLGRSLLTRLGRVGLGAGVRRFGGHVLTDNTAARRLVTGAGATLRFDEAGVLAFDLPLGAPSTAGSELPVAS